MAGAPKMLSIGTATQDVFLVGGDIFKPLCDHGVCFEHLPLGAKLDLENVVFSTGGNAGNAAVTFARQGLHSQFMGIMGNDVPAEVVLRELDHESVDTSHVHQADRYVTGYATLLLAPTGERTVLVYHGTPLHEHGDLDLTALSDADWLYISSVGSMELLERIISHAAKHDTKVAFNPSARELKQAAKLRTLLDDVTVLIANKEEMTQIVEGKTTEELIRHATNLVPYVLLSDGPKGALATDGKTLVKAGLYEDVKVIDRTGAGDAFGSGFVAMVAQGKPLGEAVTFASANSTSVVGQIGAKKGILPRGAQLHDMPLETSEL